MTVIAIALGLVGMACSIVVVSAYAQGLPARLMALIASSLGSAN